MPPGRYGWRRTLGLAAAITPLVDLFDTSTQGITPQARDIDVDLGGGRRLTGTVTGLYDHRLVRVGYSKLEGAPASGGLGLAGRPERRAPRSLGGPDHRTRRGRRTRPGDVLRGRRADAGAHRPGRAARPRDEQGAPAVPRHRPALRPDRGIHPPALDGRARPPRPVPQGEPRHRPGDRVGAPAQPGGPRPRRRRPTAVRTCSASWPCACGVRRWPGSRSERADGRADHHGRLRDHRAAAGGRHHRARGERRHRQDLRRRGARDALRRRGRGSARRAAGDHVQPGRHPRAP